METIREQTFETNLSSMHSFAVGDGIRDHKEFPKPDDQNRIHIPWRRFDDLDDLNSFTAIVQLLVIILVTGKTGHVEDLLTLEDDKRNQFFEAVKLAYFMAGLDEIEGVIIDLPKEAHGIELNNYEACIDGVADWTDMELILPSDTGTIQDLGAIRLLSNNNTALTLVSSCRGKCDDEYVLYTAALLAMNVHGKIDYD